MASTRNVAEELLAGVRRILADSEAWLDDQDPARTVEWDGLDVCDDFLELCQRLGLVDNDPERNEQ